MFQQLEVVGAYVHTSFYMPIGSMNCISTAVDMGFAICCQKNVFLIVQYIRCVFVYLAKVGKWERYSMWMRNVAGSYFSIIHSTGACHIKTPS